MTIWKREYNPFQMGGNLRRAIKTEVSGYEIVDLAKGFRGIFIEGEGVFEIESGGLIGDSIRDVVGDINACDDVELMRRQIKYARKEGIDAVLVSNEEFFK